MKMRWFIQTGLLIIALLLGAMGGIQYMNEQLGISAPAPLSKEEFVKKESITQQQPHVLELTEKQRTSENGRHENIFSEAAIAGASGLEELTRNILSALVNAIEGLNGREKESETQL